MNLSDFSFHLPDDLIAQFPKEKRSDSHLLVLNQGEITHHEFKEFPHFFSKNDLLIFNNTKVLPARLMAKKSTGGKLEIMVERFQNEKEFLAQLRVSKKPSLYSDLLIENTDIRFKVIGREKEFFILENRSDLNLIDIFERYGQMPLPPYIKREDKEEDKERYQTVYAEKKGAVAAPTAGLHFDETILEKLKLKGINLGFVTLHVGAGTFKPIRTEKIEEHEMHYEYMEVSKEVCEKIKETKAKKGRVIAIGTTSVRCLETASLSGEIKPYSGLTNIFIYPPYRFRIVDALLTNFHLSKSTLLMLVAAFAGHQKIMEAYQIAIEKKYRFFSYGDAMLIFP